MVNVNIPNTNELEEKVGLTKGQMCLIAGGVVAAGVIGFKIGKAYQFERISKGLELVLKTEPTLYPHMWEAIHKTGVVYGFITK